MQVRIEAFPRDQGVQVAHPFAQGGEACQGFLISLAPKTGDGHGFGLLTNQRHQPGMEGEAAVRREIEAHAGPIGRRSHHHQGDEEG